MNTQDKRNPVRKPDGQNRGTGQGSRRVRTGAARFVLCPSGRNHVKIMVLARDVELPESEAERIRWCGQAWTGLTDDLGAVCLKSERHPKRGWMLSVWESHGHTWLVQCLRNEFRTYNVTVYLTDNAKQTLGICEFLCRNAEGIMGDYRQQILDANSMRVKLPEGGAGTGTDIGGVQ